MKRIAEYEAAERHFLNQERIVSEFLHRHMASIHIRETFESIAQRARKARV